ncbi:hypothetical protein ACSMXM_05615 [Pacificimonas sp. ICDLI1SI03]
MSEEPAKLIDAVEEFLQAHELSPVTFGREVLNDPHFVRDLRGEGRSRPRRVWPETEEKVRDFMAKYSPASEGIAA